MQRINNDNDNVDEDENVDENVNENGNEDENVNDNKKLGDGFLATIVRNGITHIQMVMTK